jgi:hypothetical protein
MPKTEAQLQAGLDTGTTRYTAPEPGTTETVSGEDSTLILNKVNRNGAYIYNQSSDTEIWLKLAPDGAAVFEGIPVFANQLMIIGGYDGPICAIANGGDIDVSIAAV